MSNDAWEAAVATALARAEGAAIDAALSRGDRAALTELTGLSPEAVDSALRPLSEARFETLADRAIDDFLGAAPTTANDEPATRIRRWWRPVSGLAAAAAAAAFLIVNGGQPEAVPDFRLEPLALGESRTKAVLPPDLDEPATWRDGTRFHVRLRPASPVDPEGVRVDSFLRGPRDTRRVPMRVEWRQGALHVVGTVGEELTPALGRHTLVLSVSPAGTPATEDDAAAWTVHQPRAGPRALFWFLVDVRPPR